MTALMDTRVVAAPTDARVLIGRLRTESERQVAFSQAKVLFREAASMIEHLEAEIARVTADLERERSVPRAR
jgi:hypothetical protein